MVAVAPSPAECTKWVKAILGVKSQMDKINKKKKIHFKNDTGGGSDFDGWNKA